MESSPFDRLREGDLFHILRYLSYPDILRMLSTSRLYRQYVGHPELSMVLLQAHFGVDAHKCPAHYEEYYRQVLNVAKAINSKSHLYIKPTEKFSDKIWRNLYTNYRNTLGLYAVDGLEQDVEFLTVKAIEPVLQQKLPLGGAFFYHTMSIYTMRKDLPQVIPVQGVELYPLVTIGTTIVFADLRNHFGLGPRQRYIVSEVDEKVLKLINLREQFVTKPGGLRRGPAFDFSYYDFYGTDSDTLESDCTTRGIRVRAAARAIYDDERSSFTDKVFSYQIRISDAGSSPEGAKLLSREWHIAQFDQQGSLIHNEVVRGEGVIGLYPLIQKGCPDFQYESCSIVSGRTGQMKGALVFEDQKTKERFRVQVKPFKMNVAPDRFLEYNTETKITKVLF